ncbi:MAG TPA: type II toxin-antitoxin system prevent-host-death family antitoxin [Candidatus Eisenbacteria bacterium]
MIKSVKIAPLRARFSEFLRRVRSGEEFIVMDRDRPVARLVPIEPDDDDLVVTPGAGAYARMGDMPLPDAVQLSEDPVRYLLEDRESGL